MSSLMLLLAAPLPTAAVPVPYPVLRLRSEFSFTIPVPLDQAVGLFGAHGERVWAGADWNPRFLRPLPPDDGQGSVFVVDSGDEERLGLTTVFDRARGHVRHVFLLGDRCATVIDIHLTALDRDRSRVTVVYERTALSPTAEDEVRRLASRDAAQAPEWEAAIEAVAASRQGPSSDGARPSEKPAGP